MFIETAEDKEWLLDTALASCRRLPDFAIAELEGNEDAPTRITLYEVNHVNSLTMVLRPDQDGVFHCNQERY